MADFNVPASSPQTATILPPQATITLGFQVGALGISPTYAYQDDYYIPFVYTATSILSYTQFPSGSPAPTPTPSPSPSLPLPTSGQLWPLGYIPLDSSPTPTTSADLFDLYYF